MEQRADQLRRNHNDRSPEHLDVRDEEEGNGALHRALETLTERADIEEMIQESLSRDDADPNLANDAGETPLHVLCKRDNVECQDDDQLANIFLERCDEFRRGVQLDVRDARGHTALEYAAANLLPNAVEALLRRGADLAGFRFPSLALFNEFIRKHYRDFEVRAACGILRVVERLERAGYEMTRDDATTVMKIFIENDLCARSDDPDRYFYLQEEFVREATQIDLSIPEHASDDAPPVNLYPMNRVQVEMSDNVIRTGVVFEETMRDIESWVASEAGDGRITVLVMRDEEEEAKAWKGMREYLERESRIEIARTIGSRPADEAEISQLLESAREATERLRTDPAYLERSQVLRYGVVPSDVWEDARQRFEGQEEEEEEEEEEFRAEVTFHDLCLARPERTEELLAYEDNCAFSDLHNPYRIPLKFVRACGVHLCENLARRFFRRWTLEPFQRLQAGRRQLSKTCCELILKHLRNEDLWRVCLAAELDEDEAEGKK
uniref:Uncharacterized protein n=1 Tax=Trichogramma kaykai TaxID=54128 RepID=A0ABD2X505_9HYME